MFILTLHLTFDAEPMLPLNSFSLKAACAVPRGVRPTAACAAHVLSVYKSLSCIWTCLSTRAFVLHAPGRDVSAYKSFELYWTCLSTRACCCSCACLSTSALWCTWTCLLTRACCCTCACLSAIALWCTWACVCLQESSLRCTCRCALLRCIFRFVSVCFETCMFVSVVSIHVRNTEINRKKYFFGFVKQTETQPKQIEFRFFSVQTENIFCLFRGHPRQHITATQAEERVREK
jgi:hypothetical protein